MTSVWRWIARVLGRPESFPIEFAPERLDESWPVARPAGWHQPRQAVRPSYWQG